MVGEISFSVAARGWGAARYSAKKGFGILCAMNWKSVLRSGGGKAYEKTTSPGKVSPALMAVIFFVKKKSRRYG